MCNPHCNDYTPIIPFITFIRSYHIISYLQRVKFPKYLTIIPLFMRHSLSSYEYHIQWIPMEHRWNFPILSLLSYIFPILPGVSPGFLAGNCGCSLVPASCRRSSICPRRCAKAFNSSKSMRPSRLLSRLRNNKRCWGSDNQSTAISVKMPWKAQKDKPDAVSGYQDKYQDLIILGI